MQESAAERGFLTVDWLALYAQDLDFREDLQQFADKHAVVIQHVLDRSQDRWPWPVLRVPKEYQAPLTA